MGGRSERPATRAELVESLVVERYACNDWWTARPDRVIEAPLPALTTEAATDNEITWARRRRDLDREMRGAA